MKILITGGCGFIGSAVVRHVLEHTDDSVVNVDALTYAASPAALQHLSGHDRYTFEHLNICDAAAMAAVLSRHQPDAILHLAAESHVDRSIDGPAAFIQSNIVGTYTLLDAARTYWLGRDARQQASFRFHHVSTDEVYGDLDDTGSHANVEGDAYRPSSPYSASKAASDHLVQAWYRTYGLPVIISHCTNNYGPWQHPEKLIPLTIRRACDMQGIPVYGDGMQTRDWLHVDDHARALLLILKRGQPGSSYHISADQPRRNLDVVRAICDQVDAVLGDRRRRRLIEHVEDRPGHDRRYALDAGRLQRELGWRPYETLESGLSKTVKWYLDQGFEQTKACY